MQVTTLAASPWDILRTKLPSQTVPSTTTDPYVPDIPANYMPPQAMPPDTTGGNGFLIFLGLFLGAASAIYYVDKKKVFK